MNQKERIAAGARVIGAHRENNGLCSCSHETWSPRHVARELDKADLLCSLADYKALLEQGLAELEEI